MATYEEIMTASQFLGAVRASGLSPLPRVKARRAQGALAQAASATQEELQTLNERVQSDEDGLSEEDATKERQALMREDIEVDVPPVPEQVLAEAPDTVFEDVARSRVTRERAARIKEENGLTESLEEISDVVVRQLAERFVGVVDDLLFTGGGRA